METKPEAPIAKSEMSSTEAAEFLHVTRRSFARFATEGKLASQKKGNKLFFKRSDVEDFALNRGIIQTLETEPQSRILTVAQLISTVKEEVDTLKEEINAKQQLLAEREKFLSDLQYAERR